MNSRKTLRKQLVWQGRVGRVRAAVWEFERVCIYNAGSSRAVEGATFVERALVLNVGQQPGVWLGMADVRSVREVFDMMDADAGDRPDDGGGDLCAGRVVSPEGSVGAEDARLAQLATMPAPSGNGGPGQHAGPVHGIQSLLMAAWHGGTAEEHSCLAQCRQEIQAEVERARSATSRALRTQVQLSMAEPVIAVDGTEEDADVDAEEEFEERERVIREVFWKDFEPLRPLCDTRKLPDALKAAFPVSPLSLTQWNNWGDLPRTAS